MDPRVIARRDFLKASGVLSGVLAAGGSLALLAPSRTWAVGMRVLTTSEGTVLLRMARTIAPHDTLEDAAYALVVNSMDAEAAANADTRALLRAGVATLGEGFAAAPEAQRVQALRRIEASAFFKYARSKTLGTLYASPLAYAHFGYEGEAFSKGGYSFRGFNDLQWLPDVPLADSGPVPGS